METAQRNITSVTDIRVNPDNHAKFDLDPQDRFNYNKCIDVHNDIDLYLESRLGTRPIGWGGRYANFLDDIGIESNSDNGWWSKAAVNPLNIDAFVDQWMNAELSDKHEAAKKRYAVLRSHGFRNAKYNLVWNVVDAINKIQF